MRVATQQTAFRLSACIYQVVGLRRGQAGDNLLDICYVRLTYNFINEAE
jgi:hypothetical protein